MAVVAAHSLSIEEQGYFFTFLSIAAAQTLFELGITNLILHHLSHARASILLAMTETQKRAALDLAEATRLYSFWYFRRAAFLFILFIGIGGAIFFVWSNSTQEVYWQPAWVMMVAGTALSLFNLRYYCHLEAFGRLNLAYRIRSTSTGIVITVFCLTAFGFGGLLCYPLALLASNGYAFLVLRRACADVDQEYELSDNYTSNRIEIGHAQRKMAVSAIAGYVTANSLTPYTFHFFGAEVAGQVGLTMSVFSAIAAVAMARSTAEAPTYGPLIASGELKKLRDCFRATLLFSIGLALALSLSMIAARQMILELAPRYGDRVLDLLGFSVLGSLIIANVMLSVTSTVLRSFKTELLMWPSLIAALLVLTAQLTLRMNPVSCIALLAAFNAFFFFPFALNRLRSQLSNYDA